MKDRVSLYPGRVKLTPVSGQENTYDMVRADDPTQAGTPLNKATFLKDDTASVFGLGEDAVPNDVLNVLTKSVLLKDTTVTLPSSTSWQSVTYGNGKFVAVASNSNEVAYSADGVTWESATLPYSADWRSVTYGNGKFVAVIYGSKASAYSSDGVTWASTTLPYSARWSSVTYGNGKFVAVARESSKVSYSADGITWTSATINSYNSWSSVTYGNGKFVAVAYGSTAVAYSADGVTWTSTAFPSYDTWCSVTYGNGKFVTVASASSKAAYSADGITWTSVTLPSSANWQSVTYGNGKFVAVSEDSNKSVYSTDGVTWVSSTLPSSEKWRSITYGNGKFVAVAYNSDKVAYSTDGVTWTDTAPALQNVSGDNISDDIGSVLGVTKIATGSYIGTGTHGSSNPCTLTFDFEPKLLFIWGLPDSGQNGGQPINSAIINYAGIKKAKQISSEYGSFITLGGNSNIVSFSEDYLTLNWYSDYNAQQQLNAYSYEYFYVSIF